MPLVLGILITITKSRLSNLQNLNSNYNEFRHFPYTTVEGKKCFISRNQRILLLYIFHLFWWRKNQDIFHFILLDPIKDWNDSAHVSYLSISSNFIILYVLCILFLSLFFCRLCVIKKHFFSFFHTIYTQFMWKI